MYSLKISSLVFMAATFHFKFRMAGREGIPIEAAKNSTVADLKEQIMKTFPNVSKRMLHSKEMSSNVQYASSP